MIRPPHAILMVPVRLRGAPIIATRITLGNERVICNLQVE
jgi:hypothetical protein